MEKVLGYHIEDEEKWKAVLSPMKIRFEKIKAEDLRQSVKNLADGKKSPLTAPFTGTPPKESFVLFCGLSEKHLDRVLFLLRQAGMHVDFKAVMTPINQNWTVWMLLAELKKEKNEIMGK